MSASALLTASAALLPALTRLPPPPPVPSCQQPPAPSPPPLSAPSSLQPPVPSPPAAEPQHPSACRPSSAHLSPSSRRHDRGLGPLPLTSHTLERSHRQRVAPHSLVVIRVLPRDEVLIVLQCAHSVEPLRVVLQKAQRVRGPASRNQDVKGREIHPRRRGPLEDGDD